MEDVIIIGAGLAGLSAGMDLARAGQRVTILERYKVVGGRCANWVDDGMPVESGLHRWLGFYRALPRLFKKVDWRVQANIRNLGESAHLVPITVLPTGEGAAYRIADGMSWEITNTFKF